MLVLSTRWHDTEIVCGRKERVGFVISACSTAAASCSMCCTQLIRGLFYHVVMITVGTVMGNLESTACFMLSIGGLGRFAFMHYYCINMLVILMWFSVEWLLFLQSLRSCFVWCCIKVLSFWLCTFDYMCWIHWCCVLLCCCHAYSSILTGCANPQILFMAMTYCNKYIYFKISLKVEDAGIGPKDYFMLFKLITSACISEWASFQKRTIIYF